MIFEKGKKNSWCGVMTPRRIGWFLSLQDVLLTTTTQIVLVNFRNKLLHNVDCCTPFLSYPSQLILVKLIKVKKNPNCVYREREKEKEKEREHRENGFFFRKKWTPTKKMKKNTHNQEPRSSNKEHLSHRLEWWSTILHTPHLTSPFDLWQFCTHLLRWRSNLPLPCAF